MCTSTLPGGRRSLSAMHLMTRMYLRQGVEERRSGTTRPTAVTSPIGHGAETVRESSACGMSRHATQTNNRYRQGRHPAHPLLSARKTWRSENPCLDGCGMEIFNETPSLDEPHGA